MKAARIVLSGGGTGGHVYPAISVAQRLKEDPRVEDLLYIGAVGHLEERVARENGIEFVGLSVTGMPRKVSPAFLSWSFKTLQSFEQARQLLARFRPTAVLGTGGYASAPPLAAAFFLGIPYVIHEPDAHPGLVNRLFSPGARLISCGMAGAVERFSRVTGAVVVNGNPVTSSFTDLPGRESACAELGIAADKFTLVVTGGSQGAKALNDALLSILPKILAENHDLQVVHQCGDKNYDELTNSLPLELRNNPRYCLRPYFTNLALVYSVCDLVVARAGAMTISELSVCGVPAIFVPYPYAAQNHQMHNARALESKGACLVLEQSKLSGDELLSSIVMLLEDRSRLASMAHAMKCQGKPEAAQSIASQLLELSK